VIGFDRDDDYTILSEEDTLRIDLVAVIVLLGPVLHFNISSKT